MGNFQLDNFSLENEDDIDKDFVIALQFQTASITPEPADFCCCVRLVSSKKLLFDPNKPPLCLRAKAGLARDVVEISLPMLQSGERPIPPKPLSLRRIAHATEVTGTCSIQA